MKLPMSEKKEFDVAMAKELDNVIIAKAFRTLTAAELQQLDDKQIMSMRWVLAREQSGAAKAGLAVLGFMAHTITEVQTASPTMSKTGRNALLALTACLQLTLRCGDVTSAFLQRRREPHSLGHSGACSAFWCRR